MIKEAIRVMEKFMSYSRFGIYLYCRPYKKIVENEIRLVDIKDTDVVFLIGSGAIPFTAIWIMRLSEARVICVDSDLKAVKRSRKVLKKLRLDEKITVKHHDGRTDLDILYSVCIIALQVSPLAEVIDQVRFDQSRVIVRLPKVSYAKHYDVLPNSVKIREVIGQEMKAFDRSAWIEKV